MLFHIFRTFFRVEVSFAVRRGERAVNRARRARLKARVAISTTVFDCRKFAFKGRVGQYGGKPNFAAVAFG